MTIAVTCDNGSIFQHFGHTQQFGLYKTDGERILSSTVVNADGCGHGALVGFLAAQGVDALICGGIGGGAQLALAEAGIRLFGGVSGSADAAVEALLAGTLRFDPDVRCPHHDRGEGHGCGGHSCH